MRKLMLMAAMLAMVLVAAAPALAQDATADGDDSDATGGDVTTTETQYEETTLVCENVIGDINVSQGQYGDATADGDEAVAEIANEQGVSIEVVQSCIQAGEDAIVNAATGEVVATDDAAAEEDVAAEETSEEVAELPDTGGASLFTLGAGALLVGGGLLARRIFS